MFRRKIFYIILSFMIFMLSSAAFASGVSDKVTRKACKFGTVYKGGTSREVRKCKGHSYGKKINLSAYGLDGELDYVHGMYY